MSERKRSVFKVGLFGCLGLVGVGVVFFAAMAGLVLIDSRRPVDRVQQQRSEPVPRALRSPATAEQMADARGAVPLPTDDREEPELRGAGTLELDLRMGEFEVVPGDGADIEIEADYDRTRFRLDAEMTESDDGAWRYRVRFDTRSRILPPSGDSRNRVVLHVPRGLPLSVVGRIRMGSSRVELGGLPVRHVDLELAMGEHEVSFSEPTPRPIDSFEVDGRMGQVEIVQLGNASPATVGARHRMGELRLGLDGEWRNDADVHGRWRMGQLTLDVDPDVRVDIGSSVVLLGSKSVRFEEREDLPPDAPTLRLDLGGAMGEVMVR